MEPDPSQVRQTEAVLDTHGDRQSRGRFAGMRRLLRWAGRTAAVAVLAATAVCSLYGLSVSRGRCPRFLGNRPANVAAAQARAASGDFRFLLLGDSQGGPETFEKLLAVARREDPAFMVLLGDIVPRPEVAEHKWLWHEMEEEALPFPVFYLAGNHDAHRRWPVGLREFEAFYGPAQFHFTIGRNLLVFLNTAAQDRPDAYLEYLRSVLREQSGRAESIFVFSHMPPAGLSLPEQGNLPFSEELMLLAAEHGIRYFFAGDIHAFWEERRGPTTYVISGGGGARLRGREGRIFHAVRVTVRGRDVQHEVLPVSEGFNTMDALERRIAVRVWPAMSGSAGSVAATGLLVLASASWLVACGRRWRRRGDPGPAG